MAELFRLVNYYNLPRYDGNIIDTLRSINIDPESHQFLVETNLPSPLLAGSMLIFWRVYVSQLGFSTFERSPRLISNWS